MGKSRWIPTFFIFAYSVYSQVALAGTCTPPGGIGRTWCVDFGTKTAHCTDSGNCWVKLKFTGVLENGHTLHHNFAVTVHDGWTPQMKADSLFANIPGNVVEKCHDGATVCFRLKPDNPFEYVDISEGAVGEQNTGEDDVSVYDPPSYPVTAIFQIRGTGSMQGGVARLGLLPEFGATAEVPTYGLSDQAIAAQLAQQFNSIYSQEGLVATAQGRCVVIEGSECEKGLHGGASDNSLLWTLELVTPDALLTTCEEWWLADPTPVVPMTWGVIKMLFR